MSARNTWTQTSSGHGLGTAVSDTPVPRPGLLARPPLGSAAPRCSMLPTVMSNSNSKTQAGWQEDSALDLARRAPKDMWRINIMTDDSEDEAKKEIEDETDLFVPGGWLLALFFEMSLASQAPPPLSGNEPATL